MKWRRNMRCGSFGAMLAASAGLLLWLAANAHAATTTSEEVSRLNNAAVAALDNGQHTEAIDLLERALVLQPDNPTLSRNLAGAYAAYGHDLAEAGRVHDAILQYERALEADPTFAGPYIGLVNLHFEQGGYGPAERVLRRYMKRFPNDVNAYVLLGDILYKTGRTQQALAAWEDGLARDPNSDVLADRIAKAAREFTVEEEFEERRGQNFSVRYAPEHAEHVPTVLQLCESARRDLGRELRTYPAAATEVLLYTDEQFDDATRQPGHIAGLFDGKIRIRLPAPHAPRGYLKQVVYHEYAHRLVEHIAGRACPYWLNEGLAQYHSQAFSAGHRGMLRRIATLDRLPSLETLSSVNLSATNSDTLRANNLTAFAAVHYLRERYPSRLMLELLELLGQGAAPEAALQESYRHDYVSLDQALTSYVLE